MKNVLVAILLFVPTSLLAGIKAYVDRQEVHSNETFTLVVELDEFTTDTPDLSVLPKEISVLSNSKYHRSSIVNGITETQLGWKIQLMANEAGVFTIPSISVNGQSSQPIQIKVKQPSDTFSTDGDLEAIMLKGEVSKPEVYVQEQVIYTLKLFRSVQTQYASLTEPNIQDAIVEKLGDDHQYESIIDGKRYWILERKYAVFPQKSGELIIPKIIFSADVVQRGSSGYGRILGRTQPVTIATDEVKLKVSPYPAGHSGLWLPSKQITIDSRWSDPKDKVVGEPSTWTITIKGVGLHENQLPELQLPPTEGIKWYPDTAQKQRSITSEGIIGERVERVAVVPTRDGKIQLPKLTFRWFNTETKQYEDAVLPSQTIKVLPGAEQNYTPVISETTPEHTQPQVITESSPLWKWAAYVFAALWILTLMLYLNKSSTTNSREFNRRASRPQPIASKTRLINACREGNTKAIYTALLFWLNEVTGKEQTLQQHVAAIKSESIKNSLLLLESSLFSPEQQHWTDAIKLKDWIKVIEQDIKSNQKSDQQTVLPELYPES